MSFLKARVRVSERGEGDGKTFLYSYDGPRGPARAEAEIGDEDARTAVEGNAIPGTSLACGTNPRARTWRRGVDGELGDRALRVSRPSFGLLPRSRALHFDCDDGRRWFLVSSGWGRTDLRRGDVGGTIAFRRKLLSIHVSETIAPEEVALLLLCEATGPYQQVKILARLASGI